MLRFVNTRKYCISREKIDWKNKDHLISFLNQIKQKYLLTSENHWNKLTQKQIRINGGSGLLRIHSMYDIKCMGFPEGNFTKPKKVKPKGYWENEENIDLFLTNLKNNLNLQSNEDWNKLTSKQIINEGGSQLLKKYSLFEIKSMGNKNDQSLLLSRSIKSLNYWENIDNINKFIVEFKNHFSLQSFEDWNSISNEQIESFGGSGLLRKYSIYDIKCFGYPEGKSLFSNPPQASRYWDNQENIDNFLSKLKEIYNLQTPEDWNSITHKHIRSYGGRSLLSKYSIFEIKCMACPEGELLFTNPPQSPGYWENQENIDNFLSKIKEKYNFNTPEDWNSITQKHIISNGGRSLLLKYSIFEIKCMACPEGISTFNYPSGYWDNQENIDNFLSIIKEKYNLQTPEDWNSIKVKHIQSNGGNTLLSKFSMLEIKCMACPEGISTFNKARQSGNWGNQENIDTFLSKIKEKYNLNTPEDWKRFSKTQIIQEGGRGLLINKINSNIKIKFENGEEISISKLLAGSVEKRSSQRWLFLQIQKLFPGEEIVEDYFHSEISRQSGFTVQFDIFMIERNIAIEYHGQQHYEDIPSAFNSTETYKYRDLEKEKLCSEHGIQLIVIPYWWDNKIESLKETLFSKIKQK